MNKITYKHEWLYIYIYIYICFNSGVETPKQLRPHHIYRKIAGGSNACSYADIFPPIANRALLDGRVLEHPTNIQQIWDLSQKLLKENLQYQNIHTSYHL